MFFAESAMKIRMVRSVNERIRRYSVSLECNLFGEWILERTYGSASRAAPTGSIKEVYATYAEGLTHLETLICLKRRKGYRLEGDPSGQI